MALTCRWVCKSTFSVNFDELEKRFKSNIYSTFKKGKTELKYLVTDCSMATAESGAKYLRGTLYFECEEVLKLRQITDDAKTTPDNKTLKYADVVDFWISDKNFIVFSKTERSKNMQPMRRLMSEILFEHKDRIRSILFNIENIEKDLLSTKKSALWTYSFNKRQGNIDSGRFWGKNISADAVYGQTKKSTRNSVGVIEPVGDIGVKTSVNRSGSIIAFHEFRGAEEEQTLLDFVDRHMNYVSVGDA